MSSASPDAELVLLYYLLGSLGVLASCHVLYSLFRIGCRTTSCELLLYLHLTLIAENLLSFPRAYTGQETLCELVAFAHTYAGLSNVLVVCVFALHHHLLFFAGSSALQFVLFHREKIIFLAPLCVSLLPFVSRSYGVNNELWCSFATEDRSWSETLYFLCVAVVVTASVLQLAYTIVRVACTDTLLASSLLRSAGLYATTSILSWIPRALSRSGVIARSHTAFVPFLCAFLYWMVFLAERASLAAYEAQAAHRTHSGLDPCADVHWTMDIFANFHSESVQRESDLVVSHRPLTARILRRNNNPSSNSNSNSLNLNGDAASIDDSSKSTEQLLLAKWTRRSTRSSSSTITADGDGSDSLSPPQSLAISSSCQTFEPAVSFESREVLSLPLELHVERFSSMLHSEEPENEVRAGQTVQILHENRDLDVETSTDALSPLHAPQVAQCSSGHLESPQYPDANDHELNSLSADGMV